MRNSSAAPIRLLALDLDDTLLRDDLTISPRDKEAVLAAEHAGVRIVLASGRVRESMQPYADALGMRDRPGYIVSGNGTLVTRSDTAEVVLRHLLATETALTAYRLVDRHGLPAEVYIGDTAYASRDDRWVDEDCECSGLSKCIVPQFEKLIAGIDVPKIMIPGDPEKLSRLQAVLQAEFDGSIHTVTSKPYFLEILPSAADKGSAVAHIATELGIPRAQVMAIGDGMNDAGMIRYAAIGVAMPNASEELKAIADWVAPADNEHAGVAQALELVLGASPAPDPSAARQ